MSGAVPAAGQRAVPGLVWRGLRAVAPARLLGNIRNPILQKEVFVSGRRRSTYVVRCVYLLLLLAIVILSYLPLVLETRRDDSGLAFMQRVQDFAPQMTIVIIWFQFVALVLIGPTLLGGSLCDERRSGTLGALLTTPLSAFQIALGKLLAGLSQMVILVLLTMPLLLALRVFGGVPAEIVVGMASVTLSTALLASTLSLFFSARAARGFSATSTAILATIVLQGGVTLFMTYLMAKGYVSRAWMARAISLCAPASLGFATAELAGESAGLGLSAIRLCWDNTIYNLVLTGLAFVALVVRLRGVMLKDAGSQVTLLTRRQRRKNKARARASNAATDGSASNTSAMVGTAGHEAALAPSLPDQATAREIVEQDSREVGDRPVLWRELRQPAFRSRVRFVVTVLLLGGLLIFVNVQTDSSQGRHTANIVLMGIGMVLVLLMGTGAAAGCITQEREARTLDVLMTTPLSAREIVMGKFWGAMRRQWFLPTVLLAHLLLSGVLASTIPMVAILHVAVILVAAMAFLCSVGVWMSVRSKKTSMAGVLTALIGMGIWLLPFPASAMLEGLLRELGMHGLGQGMMEWAAVGNPVFLGVVSLTEDRWAGGIDDTPYRLPPSMADGGVGFLMFTTILVVVAGVYVGLAALCLCRARILLGRTTNRVK